MNPVVGPERPDIHVPPRTGAARAVAKDSVWVPIRRSRNSQGGAPAAKKPSRGPHGSNARQATPDLHRTSFLLWRHPRLVGFPAGESPSETRPPGPTARSFAQERSRKSTISFGREKRVTSPRREPQAYLATVAKTWDEGIGPSRGNRSHPTHRLGRPLTKSLIINLLDPLA